MKFFPAILLAYFHLEKEYQSPWYIPFIMKRVILQFDAEKYSSLTGDSLPENIESLKVVHILRQDDEEFSMICEVTHQDPNKVINLVQGEVIEAVDVGKRRNGIFTYYVRTRPAGDSLKNSNGVDIGGYFLPPIEVKNGWVKIAYLGDTQAIKKLLKMAEDSQVPYKVSSIQDASLSSESPLNLLTEMQRQVIIAAFENGYYDLPKKTGVKELAEKLGISGPTFVIHRRKAERRILEDLIRKGQQ
jgi:predicted DNA binding protein